MASGVWEDEDPLVCGRCCVAVMMTSPRKTVILDFERDGGMMTKNPYEDMFCHIFGQLFDVRS